MSKDKDKDKDDFSVEDMSLDEDVKHPEPLDMDLDGPDSVHIGQRIQKLFPDVDIIDLIDDFKIMKMADGNYQVKGKSLKELASMDLEKIDAFLKKEEAKK